MSMSMLLCLTRLVIRKNKLLLEVGSFECPAMRQNRELSFQIVEGVRMDRLEAMSIFLTVVEAGSLSAAARRLPCAPCHGEP